MIDINAIYFWNHKVNNLICQKESNYIKYKTINSKEKGLDNRKNYKKSFLKSCNYKFPLEGNQTWIISFYNSLCEKYPTLNSSKK